MELLAQFFVCLFGVLPLASFMTLLITSEHTLDNIIAYIIFILAYSVFALYFGKRFNEQIVIFQILITASLYSSRYDYEAIKDLTYEEFIAKHSDALKVWCQENDCYQKLSKE